MCKKIYLSFCLLLLSITVLPGQTVTMAPESFGNLEERWQWALQQKDQKVMMEGFWVGYSIKRLMPANHYIGHFYGDDQRMLPTIWEVITGTEIQPDDEGSLKDAAKAALDRLEGKQEEALIEKDVAFLFRFDPLLEEELLIKQIHYSNMTNSFRFKGLPILWLGESGPQESLSLLIRLFEAEQTTSYQEKFLGAIGLHNSNDQSLKFLSKVINGGYTSDVREKAVFWTGQLNTTQALDVLKPLIRDNDPDIAEESIFAVSQMDIPAAETLLIAYAKTLEDRKLRKKAIFWLGQSASKKVVKTLSGIAEHDEDIKVQESAVFAISQQESTESLEKLMDIATSHSSPRIRKKAIFWLGQSEDPRAVDFLISLMQQ